MNELKRVKPLSWWGWLGACVLFAGCTKSYTTTPMVAPPVGRPPCPNCHTPAPVQPVPPNSSMIPAAPPAAGMNAAPPTNVPRTGPSLTESRAAPPSQARLGQPDSKDVQTAQAVSPPAPLEFPTDIPRFAVVQEKVATGQEPFADGFAWLAKHGYRTVLYLHSPDQPEEGQLRSLAEKHGLTYRSMAVDPYRLDRAKVNEFSQWLSDASQQPIFIFDKKGQVAGSLWYLHFRLHEGMEDKLAVERAVRLGLPRPEEGDQEAEALWRALRSVVDS